MYITCALSPHSFAFTSFWLVDSRGASGLWGFCGTDVAKAPGRNLRHDWLKGAQRGVQRGELGATILACGLWHLTVVILGHRRVTLPSQKQPLTRVVSSPFPPLGACSLTSTATAPSRRRSWDTPWSSSSGRRRARGKSRPWSGRRTTTGTEQWTSKVRCQDVQCPSRSKSLVSNNVRSNVAPSSEKWAKCSPRVCTCVSILLLWGWFFRRLISAKQVENRS